MPHRTSRGLPSVLGSQSGKPGVTRCWHESAGSSQIVSYTWAERRSPQFGLVIAGFKGPPACCPHPIRVGCKKSWNLWRFKLPSGSNAPVAQGIEHRFPKAGVAGSNPAGGSPAIHARGGSQRQEEKPSASRRLWRVWFCAVRDPTAPSRRLPAILKSIFVLLLRPPKKGNPRVHAGPELLLLIRSPL